jgi:hypothetical protein
MDAGEGSSVRRGWFRAQQRFIRFRFLRFCLRSRVPTTQAWFFSEPHGSWRLVLEGPSRRWLELGREFHFFDAAAHNIAAWFDVKVSGRVGMGLSQHEFVACMCCICTDSCILSLFFFFHTFISVIRIKHILSPTTSTFYSSL